MKVFDNFFEKIYDKDIALTGMTEELFAVYVNKLYDSKKNILIVTSNLVESNSLYRSISNYVDNVYLFYILLLYNSLFGKHFITS